MTIQPTPFIRRGAFLMLCLLVLSAANACALRPRVSDAYFLELCDIGTADEIGQTLLEGANANARDDKGRTALMRATEQNKDPEVVRVLLEAGADVHARDNRGRTALMRMEEGASPMARDFMREMDEAARGKIIRLLKQYEAGRPARPARF